MTNKEWSDYLKRSKTWSIRVGHDLLHSRAYRSLKYGPALKVLNWCHEKLRFKVDKKRRGFARYQIVNDGEFTFPYSEALLRGLSSNQFSRALKDLYGFGFIDVKQFGSGMLEDPTIFTLSNRWQNFQKPNFEAKEWPKSELYGYRGKYLKGKKQRLKSNVDQRLKLNVESTV
jgi:hypothetical protein